MIGQRTIIEAADKAIREIRERFVEINHGMTTHHDLVDSVSDRIWDEDLAPLLRDRQEILVSPTAWWILNELDVPDVVHVPWVAYLQRIDAAGVAPKGWIGS
jgi:hypothetical protein